MQNNSNPSLMLMFALWMALPFGYPYTNADESVIERHIERPDQFDFCGFGFVQRRSK